jgi:Uncharacterised protein family (UPF0158)
MTDNSYLSDPFAHPYPPSPATPQAASESASHELARDEAFGLLHDVVADYETSGRKPLIQGVKPEMQRRSEGRFSEAVLGFASFRTFVEAAVTAGYVSASHDSGSHSVLLHVEGVEAKPFTKSRRPAGPKRTRAIRPDLWKAFVDWNPALGRVWDKDEEVALTFGIEAANEDDDKRNRRKFYESHPERFIAIPRIAFETQLDWMREYGESLGDKRHARVLLSLLKADEKPVNAFMSYLRDHEELSPDWNMLKTAKVRGVIEAWIRDNKLMRDILDGPADQGEGNGRTLSSRPGSAEGVTSVSDEDGVRGLVLRAVSRMPLADLLRLKIPVEYMVDPE